MPTEYKHTGQLKDDDIKLYWYQSRWYDQSLGRFAQADTIVPELGKAVSFDRYAYAYFNTIRYNDPTGHFSEEEIEKMFGVDDWDQVLDKFYLGGEFEGHWGFLEILRRAKEGDYLYASSPCEESGEKWVEDVLERIFDKGPGVRDRLHIGDDGKLMYGDGDAIAYLLKENNFWAWTGQ